MVFRTCLVFCFLAAATVSMGPSVREARLRSRLEGESWVGRANAAILLADEPRAVPRLARFANDESPQVRQNVRWALHKLTGWPWATRGGMCLEALEGRRAPETIRPWDPIPEEEIQTSISWNPPDLVVRYRFSGSPTEPAQTRFRKLGLGLAEYYSAAFYSQTGDAVEVIAPPIPPGGTAETCLISDSGRKLASWSWNVEGELLAPGGQIEEHYSLETLPPGRYVAVFRSGPATTASVNETGVMPVRRGFYLNLEPQERRIAFIR